MIRAAIFFLAATPLWCQSAVRFTTNPLVSVNTAKSIGDNANGPSVIRVPSWVAHPLGKYYMYFAHHKGAYIRLAYADSITGPWKIYDPGVLKVSETAFFRPQPDPPNNPYYTHVASPDVFIDDARHLMVMFVHGNWTEGKPWPVDPPTAQKFFRDNGYAQYTQTTVSHDGIHFEARPGIVLKSSYLRLFEWRGGIYSMARLGLLGRAANVEGPFEAGPNPFAGSPYAGRVRHVGLLVKGDTLYVFFSAIGDAPEKILLSTIALSSDWTKWKASAPIEVLSASAPYECPQLPVIASKAGESDGPEHALRDPDVFVENGRVYLFYSVCGEQGIGGADVTPFIH